MSEPVRRVRTMAGPEAGPTSQLLRDVGRALREAASEHSYRADACKVLRDHTLRRFHELQVERLWSLADEVETLADDYRRVHQREQRALRALGPSRQPIAEGRPAV